MEKSDLELGDVDIIQESVQSLLDCVKTTGNHTNPFSTSINMVPSVLRDLSPNSFNPRVVSIGPLHRDDENVKAFEGQKARYLISLMSRIKSPHEEILRSCMKKAYTSMNKIKACYVWRKTYDDAEIAKMMVMDACFILEFINRISESDESYSGNMLLAQAVIYDLVLLENQIPLFFLEKIFQCTISKFDLDTSFIEFVHPVLSFLNLFEAKIKIRNIPKTSTHILSLLHECYKPPYSIKLDLSCSRIRSAVDLDRAGVNFKPYPKPKWLMGMDVKLHRFPCFSWWWGKPTLRMPVLSINYFTELVLRNLIAYEQSCLTRNYITSYAIAMDMLVNTQEDVANLVDSRVIVNNMGSNEEAANMINSICKEVAWVHFFYDEEWKTLNMYRNGYWPKNMAWLRRTYFSSPWNIIALVAGIILFALTVVQTIFAIKSAGSNN